MRNGGRVDRRSVVAGMAATGLTAGRARSQPIRQPNILFIMADDLGYADLGCTGRPAHKTPVLDKLAAEGLLLTESYANSAVCSATRTGLITGRYQDRLEVGLREPIGMAEPEVGMPPSHPTLPSLLKALGYRTTLIGKWHLGPQPKFGPRLSGYDTFFGFYEGGADYFFHAFNRGDPSALFDGDQRVDRPGYLTDLLADRAAAEIKGAPAGAPFFMSLHFNAPHWPWEGPGDEAVSRTTTNLMHQDGGSLEVYGRMVEAMDAGIGRVLATLKAKGAERDTIVIFTSDNGGERFSDTWPFIGGKGELLEGGIRVPVIVRWPARIKPGGRSAQVNISMDWLPTLLAAAGGAPDPAYPPDGENLLPVLTGTAPAHSRKLFWRYKADAQLAVREGDWKYLRIGAKERLFNLAVDRHERADLQAKNPELFQRLKRESAAWATAMLPFPPDMPSGSPRPTYMDR